jgi:hypothetical protein
MGLNPSWKATSCLATKEFCNILRNPNLITMFTRAYHWSLSWATWIQSTPHHPISIRSTLILSFCHFLNVTYTENLHQMRASTGTFIIINDI